MSSLSGGKSTRPARVGATAKRGPFALYAPDYFDAGWFPFPCVVDPKTRTKVPAPGMKGWAPGRDNPYPDRARVEEWAKRYRGAHIMLGLRLPRTILGLDLDLYAPGGRANLV